MSKHSFLSIFIAISHNYVSFLYVLYLFGFSTKDYEAILSWDSGLKDVASFQYRIFFGKCQYYTIASSFQSHYHRHDVASIWLFYKYFHGNFLDKQITRLATSSYCFLQSPHCQSYFLGRSQLHQISRERVILKTVTAAAINTSHSNYELSPRGCWHLYTSCI